MAASTQNQAPKGAPEPTAGPAGKSSGTDPGVWRSQLHHLDGLTLLPIVGKVPVHPRTGRLLNGWQTASYSPQEIAKAHISITGAGCRTGADLNRLAAVDIDGATAVEVALEHGCDPAAAGSWTIGRDTDPARLKVMFTLTPEQSAELQAAAGADHFHHQKETRPGAKGVKEGVELFYGVGQVVVLGQHPASGGNYTWITPPVLAEPSPEWFAFMLLLARDGRTRRESSGNGSSAPRSKGGATGWRKLSHCPICGRDQHLICSGSSDGKFVNCLDGQTFSYRAAHGDLKKGQTITGLDQQTWAFCGAKYNEVLGSDCATFKIHEPRPAGGDEQPDPTAAFSVEEEEPPGKRPFAEKSPRDSRRRDRDQEYERAKRAWEMDGGQGKGPSREDFDDDDAAEDAALLAEIKSFQDAEAVAALVTPRLLFPPGVAEKVIQYAAEQQLAEKGFYLPIQCAVASVIGNRVVAVPELGSELKGIGVLWGMNMAPVSGGKSPTSKPTIETALLPWHIEEREKHAAEMREWKRGHDKAEAAAKARAKGDIVGGDDDPLGTYLADNPQPERRHILTTDCTFERLEVVLSSGSTPGILIFNDEMGRWFSQLTRTPAQSDRSKWLGLYPGAPVLTDRCGRQEVVVANPAVSLFGNLQPARMAGLWAADQKLNEDVPDAEGLWSRFLLVNLPEWDYTYTTTTVKLAPVLETLYRQVDRVVAALPPQEGAAYEIPLAADALVVFAQWTADLLAMRKTRQHEEDKGFIDKQRGNSLRLALGLHAIDCASRGMPLQQPISVGHLRAAIAEVCLFIVERDQLLGAIRGGDTGAIKRLLVKGREWRAQHGGEPVPMRRIKDWAIPERNARVAAVRAWIQQVVETTPGCGSLQGSGRSLVWIPPGDHA